MAMTERQGGSDVQANITRAEPLGDGVYELHGHKWFCSYPPCDVFLVLAQAPGGLSCFLVKRGPGMEFQRLKDKLGTRSLPSSEVEFTGIQAQLVGEEGRGVPAIIRMVNHTRLDCLLGSTTGMRRGVLEAIHHTRHRSTFGAMLADHPAMQNVLADLAVESEAATVTAMRIAASYDAVEQSAFRRFAGESDSAEDRLYDSQFQARRLVEDLALALQGSLLLRHSPPAVADAFCASRLGGEGGRAYGTLPRGVDAGAIIERALPV